MYKLHLIKKYLLKRRIAWISLLAVMLCTAMVLVVISVMGGWLQMFKDSFRAINGDVVVRSGSVSGFPYYQEMIDKIGQLPEVGAAVPMISSAGLININGVRDVVEISGIKIDQIGNIGNFPKTLYTQYDQRKRELLAEAAKPGISKDEQKRLTEEAENPKPTFNLRDDVPYPDDKRRNRTGIIVSDALFGFHRDQEPWREIYRYNVSLTMVAIKPGESFDLQSNSVNRAVWIVDTSHPRIYQMDYNRVYVPFDVLQHDLYMSDDPSTGPARTSEIQIKAKAGVDLMVLRDKVQDIVKAVDDGHGLPHEYSSPVAKTWQQGSQATFIDAVEHEVVLTTFLFSLISVVAVFLIFCIFYMIVVEKTKDIGIIKSVGATGWGVAQIFLGYGLAIGLLGAGLGLGFAYLVVRYINELHSWMTRVMGIQIWSPETYQFQKIPNEMDWHTVGWVVLVAVLSALVGALVPSLRAAGMNPVEALRYE